MSRSNEADGSPPAKPTVTLVAPNGEQREERYHPHEKVSHVLAEAVREFGKDGHLDPSKSYILVREQTPLEAGMTLAEAGVQPGDFLKVRSVEIPGDG